MKEMWLERIIPPAKRRVVNYTIAPGMCPVESWWAIARLGLPHHGAPHTGRIHWCRALLDTDGTVIGVWDWVDRRFIDPGKARMIVRVQNTTKETV